MNENKKVFFIVNKFSGAGYKDSAEGRIITHCASLGIEPTIEFTQERGHATELAKAAVDQGFERIFAVGGDGTVNEVAQALVNTSASLGILPKGSGNGLARHLGISVQFGSALQIIASTKIIKIDSVSINDNLSFNVSGIGFDGRVAAQFGRDGKRGLMGYARTVLTEFGSFNEFSGSVSIDGDKTALQGFIVAIANASQFGNNAKVAPLASVCDQLLDFCIIRKVPVLKAMKLISKLFNGTIGDSKHVSLRTGRAIELKLDRIVDYHIDGEPRGAAADFRISIVPACLNVIVPEGVGRI